VIARNVKWRAPRRRSSAAQSARASTGNRAEDVIGAMHEECARWGVAWVRKLPTPMRALGKDRAVFTAKSGVDYMGHDASGRAVYVEAKKCAGNRFYLSAIPKHQREELNRATEHGCIAVLVVILGTQRAVYALPWWYVRDMKRVSAEDSSTFRVRDLAYLRSPTVPWLRAPLSAAMPSNDNAPMQQRAVTRSAME
jgi:penicillin-binding protein-related factor A (putative recombinase)